MIPVMTKRADFLAANRGLRIAKPGFVLLVRPNGLDSSAPAGVRRYGITVTKKVGNAVVRNRIKRRFRELLHDALPQEGLSGHDHVLIGREGGIERDFQLMRRELSAALQRAAEGKGDRPRQERGAKGRKPASGGRAIIRSGDSPKPPA